MERQYRRDQDVENNFGGNFGFNNGNNEMIFGGMDKESLMKASNKLLFSCRSQITLIENKNDEEDDRYKLFGSNYDDSNGKSGSTVHLEVQLQENLDTLTKHCQKLEKLIVPNKNDNNWRKLEQIIAEKETIEKSLKISVKKRKMKDNKNSSNGLSSNKDLDMEDPLGSSVVNARRNVRDLQDFASNILHNLSDQNNLIKGTISKLLSAADTLGLSNSLMKMIGRRALVDKIIVYGGMLLILLVIFVLWWFFVR
eukprot:TRINITY_DN4710_c0_g1_i1.p1 TRINITY_DN4710_c0_g1~~TRINITY_DN4710_c0_g1_i1.p1  ORF type:complete len:254 (+),score=88.55 TRINITY_DN4710_c0_g1_i1:57-818(+)